MRPALERIQNRRRGAEGNAEELPFAWVYSFKLLGVALGCEWNLSRLLVEAEAKAMGRFGVLTKVGNVA